jgi:hypothetical protein
VTGCLVYERGDVADKRDLHDAAMKCLAGLGHDSQRASGDDGRGRNVEGFEEMFALSVAATGADNDLDSGIHGLVNGFEVGRVDARGAVHERAVKVEDEKIARWSGHWSIDGMGRCGHRQGLEGVAVMVHAGFAGASMNELVFS